MNAVSHGKLGIIKFLVQMKANVNIIDNWRFAPMNVAKYNGNLEIYEFLKQNGGRENKLF